MKNIHVLPTDKPSRLHLQNGNLVLHRLQYTLVAHNIYIASNEEIKEGDWCIDEKENIVKADKDFIFNCSHEFNEFWKKIILTTDVDLIKDGVQAIDDEFLEWFVKNPSCEFVEIRYNVGTYNPYYLKFYEVAPPKSYYKIIIPKEPTLTITLNKDEVRGLLNCIIRTSAKGEDLDIGEMVEDKLVEFLNS